MRGDLWDDPKVEVVEKPNWNARALEDRLARRAELVTVERPQLEYDASLLDNSAERSLSLEEKNEQRKKLEALNDQLYEEVAQTCRDMLKAGELEADENGEIVVPPEWTEELQSEKKVGRRKRLAMMALQNAKEAPVLTKMAPQILIGMAKIQASRAEAAPRTLNVAFVQMAVPMPQFAEKIISSE